MKKTLNVLVPSVLALFVASAAHAGATFDTPQGKLNIGGDVEYNIDAYHANDTDSTDGTVTDHQNNSGRILFDVNGERVLANGNFAGFKMQPVYDTNGNGKRGEDFWFSFGVKNDWAFKMGQYEAYNLSPDGQDTYVESNSMYRAKAARGRVADGSQAMLSKDVGQWHMELGTVYGSDNGLNSDRTDDPIFGNVATLKEKDPLMARPVVAWTGDTVTVAAGAELNLISDAYVTTDGKDASDWAGYGATATVKATDDLSMNISTAYRDDYFNVDQFTVGGGAQYQNFYISYFYGTHSPEVGDDITEHLTYASYKIPAIMGIDNFDMYLGASYSKQVYDAAGLEDTENYGARVRFKYFF